MKKAIKTYNESRKVRLITYIILCITSLTLKQYYNINLKPLIILYLSSAIIIPYLNHKLN